MLFFYHTYPLNMCVHLCQMQETGGGQGRSRVQLFNDQNHTFFVSYVCFLSQLCLHPPVHTETRGEKKHILLLFDEGEQRGGC